MIPALVLTAGLATRLRPLSLLRAKAVLPVAGVPLVRRILRGLRAAGVVVMVMMVVLHRIALALHALLQKGAEYALRAR